MYGIVDRLNGEKPEMPTYLQHRTSDGLGGLVCDSGVVASSVRETTGGATVRARELQRCNRGARAASVHRLSPPPHGTLFEAEAVL